MQRIILSEREKEFGNRAYFHFAVHNFSVNALIGFSFLC